MLPLYADPWFTFRFADDRLIPRFHLEGVPAGQRVAVLKIDPATGVRLNLLTTATVGDGGWVDLAEPIVVRAGDAFVAVPEVPPLIRLEKPTDLEAIRHVNRCVFGQDAEGQLVDALRAGGHVRASLVAEKEGQVVGHILFSELPIISPATTTLALALAPMAVLPEYQNQGVGSALVRGGLEHCRREGHRIVVVLGHPHYYPRFGFSPALAARLESPYAGEAFMALELVTGALANVTGAVHYPPPFSNL